MVLLCLLWLLHTQVGAMMMENLVDIDWADVNVSQQQQQQQTAAASAVRLSSNVSDYSCSFTQ
jgi:hypothetical protein